MFLMRSCSLLSAPSTILHWLLLQHNKKSQIST